jgi:hypothetical protein
MSTAAPAGSPQAERPQSRSDWYPEYEGTD